MLFGNDRDQLRQLYVDSWRKRRNGEPLQPLEAQIATVIENHPEYHSLLEGNDGGVDKEFTPEGGESNPFLHMGMHIAIGEQVATDRPTGITQLYRQLVRSVGDIHQAEHQMIDKLGETLWRAQRDGCAPDEASYLEAIGRLSKGRR